MSVAFAVLAACLPAPTVGAQPVDSYARYYYFDEPRDLPIDGSRIAIRDRRGRPEEIEEFLRGLGIPEPALDRSFTGWSLFQVSEASGPTRLATEERIAGEIERFGTADAIGRFFFSPVFVGKYGPVVPTSKVLVRFVEGAEDDLDGRPLTDWEVRQTFLDLGVPPSWWEPLSPGSRTFVVEQPGVGSGVKVMRLANRLAEDPRLLVSEPNMAFSGRSAAYFPNDPSFGSSWGLHNTGQAGGTPDMDIDAPEAWERTLGDPSVIVVIIDTGVERGHPDLPVVPGRDFTSDGGTGEPFNSCDNHGTPVAGIIGMTPDNGRGSAGVAPGTTLVSARAFRSRETGGCDGGWRTTVSWTVAALEWSASLGAKVTNNSNFYPPEYQSPLIADAYSTTWEAGMVHFASAGNDSYEPVQYPASLEHVNAVSAIGRDGWLTTFSALGPDIAFTAPGEQLFTTDNSGSAGWVTGDYLPSAWGTSFSSPMVAGVAALLFSQAYSVQAAEVESILQKASIDLGLTGQDEFFGWGLPKASHGLERLDFLSDDFESGDLSSWSQVEP